MADPFATNADGTAKDPAAYAAALRADPERVKALEARAARPGAAACVEKAGGPARRPAAYERGCATRPAHRASWVHGRKTRLR